jgi:hypothetical protein
MAVSALLVACGGGGDAGSSGSTNNSPSASAAPAPSTPVSTPPTQNAAPQISGTPPTSAAVDSGYVFAPQGSDADGQTLVYSIVNKPAWASFDAATGRLTGTPTSGNAGVYAGIVISVSDGVASASLPAFSITVTSAPGGSTSNRAPTITGAPVVATSALQTYSFTPVAADADGQRLTFSIVNKPDWATFNATTGSLTGTPTSANLGTTSGIVISVSDGVASASLPPFSLTVSMPVGVAELIWTKPTRNEDGTALANLAGYRIRYGASSSALSQTFVVSSPDTTTASIEQLAAGTWYFTVASFTAAGVESAQSAVISAPVR